MPARKLPSGVQTFSHVRLDYDVYVDKTLHIYNMAKKIIKLGVKFSSKKKNVVDWGLC